MPSWIRIRIQQLKLMRIRIHNPLVQVPMTKLELRSVLEPYGEPTVTEMSTPYRGYVFVDLRTTEARAVQVKGWS